MANHEYTVELRIWGDTLDAAVVTRELGLEPCHVRVAGASRFAGRIDRGMWAYNGPPGSQKVWTSLDDGLRHLLEHLLPRRQQLESYLEQFEVGWWCGHFQSSFDGKPILSPEVLTRLGEVGAKLFIDTYFVSTPDDLAEAAGSSDLL